MSKKLESILDKLQKEYKLNITNPNESGVIERLTLDSPSLNYCFGGGMPLGRMMYIQGPESGGKSTLATYLATQVQKKYEGKNTVLYMDYEYTFSSQYASEMGLDLDNNFILIRPMNGEDGFNLIREIVETGEIGLVIIDSITTMSSKSACEDAFSGFAGGKNAIMVSSGLRMINPYLYNNKCSMIIVSQERANVGVMYGADFKGTGGRAPAYYSSWSARVTRTGDIIDPNTKELRGIEMRVRNTKNKVGIAKRDAHLKLYFNSGINSDDEYVDYLKVLGLVEQKGAYYSNPEWTADDGTVGMKVCGLDAVKEYLHNNPVLYSKIKNQVNTLISGHNVLDEGIEDRPDDDEDIPYEGVEVKD